MSEKLVQYHILEHDAESNKQLYDSLQQKLKEASITAGLRSSNIRIVDPALVPTHPARPQKSRNILLAFLVGLIGGVGLALLREYLDNTVKSPDDIERLAGLAFSCRGPGSAQSQARARPRAFRQIARQMARKLRKRTRIRASRSSLSPSRSRRFPKRFVLCARLCCFRRPTIRRR